MPTKQLLNSSHCRRYAEQDNFSQPCFLLRMKVNQAPYVIADTEEKVELVVCILFPTDLLEHRRMRAQKIATSLPMILVLTNFLRHNVSCAFLLPADYQRRAQNLC